MPEIVISSRLLIPIIITAIAPLLIMRYGKNENVREGFSFVAAIASFLSVLSLVPGVLNGKIYLYTLFVLLPGIEVKFCADGLAMIFGLIASFFVDFGHLL